MLSRIQTLLRYQIFYIGIFRFSVSMAIGEKSSLSIWKNKGVGSKDICLVIGHICQMNL